MIMRLYASRKFGGGCCAGAAMFTKSQLLNKKDRILVGLSPRKMAKESTFLAIRIIAVVHATLPRKILSSIFSALCVISSASGNEPPEDSGVTSQPSTEPTDYFRSDLDFSELNTLEERQVSDIKLLLDHLDTDFPPQAQRPPVEITGINDSATAAEQSLRFGAALARRDINRLLFFIRKLQINPVYKLANDAIQFESQLEASSGQRLADAIRHGEITRLEHILEIEQPDLEQYLPSDGAGKEYVWGISTVTPLLFAVAQGDVNSARRLLKAGADPDTRDRGGLMSPLFKALLDNNDTLIRLLGEAGADLDQIVGGELRMSPIAWCLSKGERDRAALLVKLGADPDIRDYAGWTALMDALFYEDLEAVELLLSVSDPRISSQDDITPRHRSKKLDLPFLPRGNALFLAQRMLSSRASEIANALRNRAAELDPETGAQILELSAQHSRSRLLWFEGRKQMSIEAHRKALMVVDVPSLTGLSNGNVISKSMEMLTELHEMLLITGQAPSAEEYASVAHITDLGGWHAPLHEMLDIIAAGRETYPSDKLNAWQAAYGTPVHDNWNFERLNNWVESIQETKKRDRLFDVLDFFEQNGWQR